MEKTSKSSEKMSRNRLIALSCVVIIIAAIAMVPKITLVEHFDDFLTFLQFPRKHLDTNPYLQWNFAPVFEEHVGIPMEIMNGEIPPNLEGMFVRSGPNPLPGWSKRYHWFDGHGMLHNIRIKKDGTAFYTNQYIKTPRYVAEKELGVDYFFRSGELVGITGLLKLIIRMVKFEWYGMNALTNGAANTDTVMYNGHFYLLNEGNLPFEVKLKDDGSIDPLGFSKFGGVLDYPVSAHPKVDFVTNSLLFHSYSADPKLNEESGAYKFGELLVNGTVRNYRGIQRNHTCFAHDMMITKDWMVLYDSSVHFDTSKIFEGKNIFAWNDQANLEIGLVSRATGDVTWYDMGSPYAMIHPFNAWQEDDGTVVIWTPIGDHMELDLMNEEGGTNFFYVTEIRINPLTGEKSMERIDTQYNQEFCNVRTDWYGRFAHHGVAGILDSKKRDGAFTGFINWDIKSKKIHKKIIYGEKVWGGEPVVIEKPGSDDSKDFYVGTFVYDDNTGKSSFRLYEEDKLVVELYVPTRVPFGFHGNWIPERQLKEHLKSQTRQAIESTKYSG